MNALTPIKLLRVVEGATSCVEPAAILGRNIRTSSERISRYCITGHEPIYEDLATLVEGMAFFDRSVTRKRSGGWTRELPLQIPVYEQAQFQRSAAVQALAEAAGFLTGDRWSFEFVAREGPVPSRQGHFVLPQGITRHIVPFSDGLDSFAQVRFSVSEHGKESVMLVRAGLSRDRIFPNLLSLRVPRKFSGTRMREVSYRTRPLVFYTLAAIAAAATQAEAVAIGESGQGSIGPGCLPFADEWWFRSAHPAFVVRWANFLRIILDKPIRFEQPQLWKTKGEVLANLRAAGLTPKWEQTSSCSTRPQDRHGRHGCGICGGCLLRTVSAHAAGLNSPANPNTFDVYAAQDIGLDREGRQVRMLPADRDVAVRAIAAMEEFARLADSPEGAMTVSREARLIAPYDPGPVQAKLHGLLKQHRSEWSSFMSALPDHSWVREIVSQL